MVILFSTKCFWFVYMYIDILKLKACKLFENSDADLSWLLFLKEPTCLKLEFILSSKLSVSLTEVAASNTLTNTNLVLSQTIKLMDEYVSGCPVSNEIKFRADGMYF